MTLGSHPWPRPPLLSTLLPSVHASAWQQGGWVRQQRHLVSGRRPWGRSHDVPPKAVSQRELAALPLSLLLRAPVAASPLQLSPQPQAVPASSVTQPQAVPASSVAQQQPCCCELEHDSRRQLCNLLGRLQEQGSLSKQQAARALELATELDMRLLHPDVAAAALLVVLGRAEGRGVSAAWAGRAVRRACGSTLECRLSGSSFYCSIVAQVRQLGEEHWAGSAAWQQLLGPPVSHAAATRAQAQQILERLAAEGPARVAVLASAAPPVLAAYEPGHLELAGNLAGALLMLVSTEEGLGTDRHCGNDDGAYIGTGQPLGARLAARAVRAVGGKASQTGVAEAARRLGARRAELGLLPVAVQPGPVGLDPQRLQLLQALFERIAAGGEVPAADLPLIMKLASSLRGVSWPPSTLAAALLLVVERARGAELSQSAAAAVVRRAGGESPYASSFHLKALFRHWKVSPEWQSLLGPPKDTAAAVQEGLASLLRQLSANGALSPNKLSIALQLAADMHHTSLGVRNIGAAAGALLLVLAAAQGERMGRVAAVRLVHGAGGHASDGGIVTQLARLQEHWEQSEVWRQHLGEPLPASTWAGTPRVPLPRLLRHLASLGQLDPALVPAAEQLGASLGLHPAASGNFAAAVLAAVAWAHGGQLLPVKSVVAAVKAAGSSASPGSSGALLRQVLACWQGGDEAAEALLGPCGMSPARRSENLIQLDALLAQLSDVEELPPSQLQLARQLGAALVQRARQPWRAGAVAAALLATLAAAKGCQLRPAAAGQRVREVAGVEADAQEVLRHKATLLRLWQASDEWQAQLGKPPSPPRPARTSVSRLLRALALRGMLPASQLHPALALARRLKVPQPQAGAVAAALAVGWTRATGRRCSSRSAAAALATEPCGMPAVADVRAQLERLQERWGPPSSWASALQAGSDDPVQRQGWCQLAVLLQALERSGHLRPGQAAKALYLAQTLEVWTGRGPSQKPGNLAGALLLVAVQAPGGSGRGAPWGSGGLSCAQAVAAVREAGAEASGSSINKWLAKCMRQWRESPDWQAVLGGPAPGQEKGNVELLVEVA